MTLFPRGKRSDSPFSRDAQDTAVLPTTPASSPLPGGSTPTGTSESASPSPNSPHGTAPTPAGPSSSPTQPPSPENNGASDLRHRRDALVQEVTELHWDLGGLAYEMAIRDHFRVDVLVRRAAVLQERDAELAELERLLRLEESASAGSCPHCAAPHSRGAVFCWQCGATLMERAPSAAVGDAPITGTGGEGGSTGGRESTAIMDELLAPNSKTSRSGSTSPSED